MNCPECGKENEPYVADPLGVSPNYYKCAGCGTFFEGPPTIPDALQFRPIRFYCTNCRKEIWEEADLDKMGSYTIEGILEIQICSDCLLQEAREVLAEPEGKN